MAPKDFKELEDMLDIAINKMDSPVVIRYPRGRESEIKFVENNKQLEQIKNKNLEIIMEGKDISILAIGKMVSKAVEVAQILEKRNIESEVINIRFLKPLDKSNLIDHIIKTKKVITIEDGTIMGGLYTQITELVQTNQLNNVKVKGFAYGDKFIQHGEVTELEKINGLNAEDIAEYIIKNYITKK